MPKYEFSYQEFEQDALLPEEDRNLLTAARQATDNAYAPYSHFRVGCAVLLQNGQTVTGVNIENASYPVGICAERSALSTVLSQFPTEKILKIAISYVSPVGENKQPAFPCGMCRQFISECEQKNGEPIALFLSAREGTVIRIDTAQHLLPFSFGPADLES